MLGSRVGMHRISALCRRRYPILLFGQTRVFFVMSRDGLLPEVFSRVHPRFRTPHVITAITGLAVAIAAAFFPVGQLADISNAGTLYAFLMVAVAVLVLRRKDPGRRQLPRYGGGDLAPRVAGCCSVPQLQRGDAFLRAGACSAVR